jgi:hypothetical protein
MLGTRCERTTTLVENDHYTGIVTMGRSCEVLPGIAWYRAIAALHVPGRPRHDDDDDSTPDAS